MRYPLLATLFLGVSLAPWLANRSGLRAPAAATQQAPSAAIDPDNSGYPVERGACLTMALGPAAAAQCGALRIVHPLPSIRTFNTTRTPTLIYNSEFAHPYTAVPVYVTQNSLTTTPVSVEVELKLQVGGVYSTRATQSWPGTEWPANVTTTRRVTVVDDALLGVNDTTGYYGYQVVVTNVYPGGVRLPAPAAGGKSFFINRSTSPFGAGWWLAGLDRIINHSPTAPEIGWIGGDGSVRFFLKHWALTNTWYTSAYDKADSLYYDPGTTTWAKTGAGGVRTKFDATGKHVQTVDRFGRITQFGYTGGGTLSTITIPPSNAVYTFNYTSGRLTSVTAPPIGATTRITSITNPAGQITAIRSPGDSLVSFAYLTTTGNSNLIATRTNRRAGVDTFVYDSARRIRSSRIKMGGAPAADIVLTLVAGETRGTANSGSPSSVDTSKIYTWVDGPRTDVADTTVLFQSRFGPVRRLVDAVAQVTAVQAKPCSPSAPQQACSWHPIRVQSPTGRVQLAEYDVRGNVVRQIDSITTVANQRDTTCYEWDGKFDQLTKIVPPERDSTVLWVSTSNGRRDSAQDARGQPSQVKYTYTPDNQVLTVVLPPVNGATATYTYAYESTLKTLLTEQTPKGYVTTYTNDAIGRVIKVSRPIDTLASSTRRTEQRVGFDLLDRVLGDTAATLNVTQSQSVYVRNFYNAEGQIDSVRRSIAPANPGFGTLTSR